MKINIIILVSLINSFVMMRTELSAQEDVSWEDEISWDEEEVWREEVTSNLGNKFEFTEEITDSSESGDEKEIAVSDGNEDKLTSEVVPIEAEPDQPPTTVNPEPNTVESTHSEEEIPPQLVSSDDTTTITNQENSNQLNNLSEENSAVENPVDGHGEILPSITYDPPVILEHSVAVKEESPPNVQVITTEESTTPVEELVPTGTVQSIDSECNNPATYFNDIREAHLPAVEIPLYIDINGQAISSIGLFSVKLRIPFGFADFELKEAVFKEILLNPSPCNAKFIPETGILTIPQVEIPTLITVAGSTTTQPQVGPVIKCRAVLQQSNIRISVLSLKELQCDSPLSEPVQTDIN